MSYFAPYIDASGVHMPTFEDRLADLCEAYRNIFGPETELSEAVPDYQLLSVFAKALDDTSALALQAYNSRNPLYASGNALDLLLPLYGLSREAGETDASARNRIRHALAGKGGGSYDALRAAVMQVENVRKARIYVNDTDSTDARGIPGHSIAAVVKGGGTNTVAQALYDKKAPGIGTYGSTTGTASDGEGRPVSVSFSRNAWNILHIYLFITVFPGGDRDTISGAVIPAVRRFVEEVEIGGTLIIPQLYGVIYAANPGIANTFVVNDIQAAVPGGSSVVRDKVDSAWNEVMEVTDYGTVEILFS